MNKNLAIKINNLFKTYDNVKAVQGIDLEINKGEYIFRLVSMEYLDQMQKKELNIY